MITERIEINPEMMKWARISAGFSIEEAKKKITTKLEEIESGEISPTLRQLYKAAKQYQRPVQIFNFKKPPKDYRIPHDFRRYKSGTEKSLSHYNILEIRKSHYKRKIALQLSDYANDKPFPLLGISSINDDVDLLANRIREYIGISLDEQFSWNHPKHADALNSWIEAFEEKGILVFQISYHGSVKKIYKIEFDGFCIKEETLPVIATNRTNYKNRQIFTLFHELAHLCVRTEAICNMAEYRDYKSQDQDVEVFCNEVASATLVPSASFIEEDTFIQKKNNEYWTDEELRLISHKYSVSRYVILNRLRTLGKISVDLFWKMKAEMDEAFRKKEEEEEARRKKQEKPGYELPYKRIIRSTSREFQRRVLLAYYHEDITTADIANYIGIEIKHLDLVEQRVFEGKVS